LLYCIYQYYFHPLAKYPGPFLAKITELYAAYHAWKGDIHIDMWRCHEKYGTLKTRLAERLTYLHAGKFVRYRPNTVNINSQTALKEIYRDGKNFVKSPNYRVLRHQAANTLTMIDKKEASRRRRIMSQGVSDAAIRELEPKMLFHIKKCFSLVGNMDDEGASLDGPDKIQGWTESRNMGNWSNWLAFDIMCDLIFGIRYDLLGSATNRFVISAIEESNKRVSVLLQAPIIRSIGRIDRFFFPRAIEARNKFLGFVGNLIKSCLSSKCSPGHKTMFSSFTSTKDPMTGEVLSMKEIIAETTTLCVAGADTSSTAMAGVFFYLSQPKYRAAYDRAIKEVRAAFASADDIRIGPQLNSCIYLRACIDESLRLAPPVGSSLYRQVTEGGARVDGEKFPAGVELGVGIYSIHHHPEFFPDPFTFRPERWIPSETPSVSVEKAHSAYCPFSVGSRSCIGKGMALVELMLAMATALYTLDFKRTDGDTSGTPSRSDEFHLRDHITGSKNGPLINFRARD
jgi:cytochrome P450